MGYSKKLRIVLQVAVSLGMLTAVGCATHGEGYYGQAALPASYYYGPDYYDPSYPYYYNLHRHDHDWHGDGHFDRGRDRSGNDDRAMRASHVEHPAEAFRAGESRGEGGYEGRGAATAAGHIGGSRR